MKLKINEQESKLVFIGGRDRGLECLQALLGKGERIEYIFCMPEDAHEREKYYHQIKSLADKRGIPIVRAPLKYVGRVHGCIVSIKEEGVDVLTGDGLLRIEEVETKGRERLPANKILRSIKSTLGR